MYICVKIWLTRVMYPSIVYNVHVYVELVLNMSKREIVIYKMICRFWVPHYCCEFLHESRRNPIIAHVTSAQRSPLENNKHLGGSCDIPGLTCLVILAL